MRGQTRQGDRRLALERHGVAAAPQFSRRGIELEVEKPQRRHTDWLDEPTDGTVHLRDETCDGGASIR